MNENQLKKKLYDYNTGEFGHSIDISQMDSDKLKKLEEPSVIKDCNENNELCDYVESLIEEERTTS